MEEINISGNLVIDVENGIISFRCDKVDYLILKIKNLPTPIPNPLDCCWGLYINPMDCNWGKNGQD